jgi:hypothetical protein
MLTFPFEAQGFVRHPSRHAHSLKFRLAYQFVVPIFSILALAQQVEQKLPTLTHVDQIRD